PSSAGVHGAKLTLKLSDRENQQTTITDGAGAFRFERAKAGAYELRVEKEGFKMNISRIKIGSRAPAAVRIVLSIADVRQEITVSTQAARVSTDTADNLDTVTLDRQALDDLPIF